MSRRSGRGSWRERARARTVLAIVAAIAAGATTAGCRLLAGIDDTSVATDAPDAPTVPGDGPQVVDGPPGHPDAAPGIDGSPACTTIYGPELVPGHFYRAPGGVNVPFATAESDCADDIVGHTHMVIVDDQIENDAMTAILNNEAWLGISRSTDVDPWKTVLDQPATFFLWASGEPGAGEFCATLKDGIGWRGANCTNTRHYICECE